jgi:hypothetical protein
LNSHLKIFAVVCAMALLIPAGASAKRPEGKPEKSSEHGKSGKPEKAGEPKLKLASANVKGVVTANDGTTMTVTVDKASGHAKACKGMDLTFDVSDARFHTADNDADGDMDAADVLVGHKVKVRTKLALVKGKKTTCAAAEELALFAKAVHNRTTPQADEDDDATDEDKAVDEDESAEDEDSFDDEDSLDDEEELDEEEVDGDEGDVEEGDDF